MTDREMAVMASVAENASRKAVAEVLDQIAAEIKNIEYLSCPQPYVVLNDVLEIIDKYKAESEKV